MRNAKSPDAYPSPALPVGEETLSGLSWLTPAASSVRMTITAEAAYSVRMGDSETPAFETAGKFEGSPFPFSRRRKFQPHHAPPLWRHCPGNEVILSAAAIHIIHGAHIRKHGIHKGPRIRKAKPANLLPVPVLDMLQAAVIQYNGPGLVQAQRGGNLRRDAAYYLPGLAGFYGCMQVSILSCAPPAAFLLPVQAAPAPSRQLPATAWPLADSCH